LRSRAARLVRSASAPRTSPRLNTCTPPAAGTPRPAHYHVIVDEANLTADQVHDFTFELCHVYQRATKVVSCPVHSLLLGCLSPPTSAVAEAARSVTL